VRKKANLIGLLFSLIIIFYVVAKLDWQAVQKTFSQIDLRWLLAAFGVYLFNYILRSLRFQILLDLEKVPFRHILGITNLYGMYLYLMPAKSGELSYPILLKSRLNVPLPESTATLIAARFIDFATVALFLPAVLISFWDQIHPWVRVGALLFVGGVFLFGVGILWFVRHPASIKVSPSTKIIQGSSVAMRLWRAFTKLVASLHVIDQRKQYGRLWLLTIAIWICVQTNFYFIILSLGESLNFLQMVVVSIIMVPMTLLPIQGFANLGTHEIGWVAAFALFGYSETTALNIAVSSHIVLLLFVLLLGSLGVVFLREKSNSEMTEKTAIPSAIRIANVLLDRVIPPLRWLLFPFKLLTRFLEGLRQLIWLLSNEYTKRSLGACGKGVRIHGRFRVSAPQNMHLGDNVHINDNAFIRAEGGLKIGDNTHISRNVVIYTMNHKYEGIRLPYDENKMLKPVEIGRNVWVGMNVVIVPGITIGDGAIIGMGAVVAQDIPALTIIGSQPVRILKERDASHYEALEHGQLYSGMSGYEWQRDEHA